jgi:hypothetical protein
MLSATSRAGSGDQGVDDQRALHRAAAVLERILVEALRRRRNPHVGEQRQHALARFPAADAGLDRAQLLDSCSKIAPAKQVA